MEKKKPTKKKNYNEEIEELAEINNSMKKNFNVQYKINLKFKNKRQKEYYSILSENRVVFVDGCAGTGKTIIALLMALELLKSGEIKKIIITKPIVEASSPMGFLPGNVESKIDVYMHSFYSNIEKIIGSTWLKELLRNNILVCVPLNYMRGNTLGGVDSDGNPTGYFCILDEMQNCTIGDVKLFLSRLGENSKFCLIGDSDQTDLKVRNGERSSIIDSFERFKGIDKVGFMKFEEEDIVRDPLLIEIMKRYKTNI